MPSATSLLRPSLCRSLLLQLPPSTQRVETSMTTTTTTGPTTVGSSLSCRNLQNLVIQCQGIVFLVHLPLLYKQSCKFYQDFGLFTLISSSRPTYLNAISDPKVSSDPSYRVPVPVTGYVSPSTQAEQLLQHQQSQPQFIPPNARYIQHPAVGTVLPVPPYFPIAARPVQQLTPTQPFHPQFRMCYVPLAAAPPNLGDPSSVPPSAKLAVAVPSVPTTPELPVNSYRSAPAPAPASLQPQLIRVASNPHAGTGYHVMQQQALLPRTPATAVTYGAELAATPGHPALYHARAFSRPVVIPQQYQTVCSTAVTRHAAAPGDSNTSGAS